MNANPLKNIFFLFALICCVFSLHADTLFNQNYPEGGFLEGAYDTNATAPTPYNTTRTSAHEGPKTLPSVLWKRKISFVAILTAPAIARDGTIYIGSNDSYLYALDSNASLKWKYKTKSNVQSSPIIRDDESILFGSRDQNLYALSKDGELLWTFNAGAEIEATPVLDTQGNIYFGTKGNLFFALNKEGKLLWKTNLYASILAACAIDKAKNIYVGNQIGTLYSLSMDGKIQWKYKTKAAIRSAPAIDHNGTIYVSSTDWSLHALSAHGELLYSYRTAWHLTATPALGFNDTLYIGSWDWNMHALSRTQGTQLWKTNIGNYATYISGSALIDKNSIVYAGSRNDYFYAFDTEGTILWKIHLQGDVLSAPTLSKNGVLLIVTDKGWLYALK